MVLDFWCTLSWYYSPIHVLHLGVRGFWTPPKAAAQVISGRQSIYFKESVPAHQLLIISEWYSSVLHHLIHIFTISCSWLLPVVSMKSSCANYRQKTYQYWSRIPSKYLHFYPPWVIVWSHWYHWLNILFQIMPGAMSCYQLQQLLHQQDGVNYHREHNQITWLMAQVCNVHLCVVSMTQ